MPFEFIRRLSNPNNQYQPNSGVPPTANIATPPATATGPVEFDKIPKQNPIANLLKEEKYHRSSDNLHVSL
ncbi:hypothetical protein DICA1_F26522 [Diutina catenulata]